MIYKSFLKKSDFKVLIKTVFHERFCFLCCFYFRIRQNIEVRTPSVATVTRMRRKWDCILTLGLVMHLLLSAPWNS